MCFFYRGAVTIKDAQQMTIPEIYQLIDTGNKIAKERERALKAE
jgi:hypothetical protein